MSAPAPVDPVVTPGYAAGLSYGTRGADFSTLTFTPLTQITDIKPPELEADDIETSNMDNVDRFKTFTAGWADGGEVEVTAQYAKTQATSVYSIYRADKAFKMTFEDGSIWYFNGYLKKLGGEIDRENLITQTLTFKISGKPSFVAAA